MSQRILFIGGTRRGLNLMEMLIALGKNIVYAYILEEDKHEIIKVSGDLKELCSQHNIPVTVCKRLDSGNLSKILEFKPDVAFVCGWRTLIPSFIYKNIPIGCIAAHDSLLPRYRGFAPLNWAIINGEKQTGVTLFKIDDGAVDSGKIFKQKTVEIGDEEVATDVYPRINKATVELYKDFLCTLEKGTLEWRDQDETQATYTCKRVPEDGEINWTKSAANIFNLIRALSPPYPCAWTKYNGEKFIIERASLPRNQLRYEGNTPGRVVSVLDNGILVLCGTGQIILNRIASTTEDPVEAREVFSSIATTLGK